MVECAKKMAQEQKWTYNQKGDRGISLTLEQLYSKRNIDCSSFVSSLYHIFLNVDPGSNTREMKRISNTEGSGFEMKPINGDFSQLVPGDILFMDGHVGLYIGDEQQIDAGGPTGVAEPNVDKAKAGYTHFIHYIGN